MQFVIRQQAAQSTIDTFLGKPFVWGARDCAHLASFAIRLLGHGDPLAQIKPYGTMRGARKAMKAAGITDIGLYLDSLGFERIGYASALPGDIAGMEGAPMGADTEALALGVFIGNGRLIAFADHDGTGPKCAFADAAKVSPVAWRVPINGGAI